MAGGKETPRQKMIGMMYLVLTALLALNVSKQILDAFVAIEDNIQRGSITQLERGNAARSALIEEMNSTAKDASGKAKIEKIKKYLGMIEKIDGEAGKLIKYIDDIKLEMLEKAKEDVKTVKDEDEKVIVWKKYDPKFPLQPTRLNLMAVQAKDQFDIPMHEIVGSEISKLDPTKHGIKLWKQYNGFRKFIVETTGTYKEGEKNSWKVKVTDINDNLSNLKLQDKIVKMITAKSNKVNPDDQEVLLGLYQELTKIEFADHHEQKNIHWMGRTFDHAPMVGALASLSSLQNEILSARAKAVNLLKSKVTVGEFSFNKIQELVSGPGVATEGEEIELKVTMAAYDSDNNPVVTGPGSVEVKDGIGTIKTRASGSGEMNLSGTVMIRNKSGVEYPKNWSWKVAIAKPQGSISLPEMSVLYKGWNNKVVPVVAGMVSSDITVNGGTKTKASWTDADGNKYNGFYVNITGPSKFVTITLSGKDKDGKSKSFGTFKYKVKPFPSAQLQGTSISKTTGFKAVVSLGPDSPFTGVGFTVMGGEVSIGNETIPFSGDRVPASVVAKIKAGKKIAIDVTYKRTGTATPSIASGVLKVVP
ncbi:MAG: hypothetical protein RLZZ30_403 [Bacteroidota bacterium]|jgi:hypothetical protein